MPLARVQIILGLERRQHRARLASAYVACSGRGDFLPVSESHREGMSTLINKVAQSGGVRD